ncbi:hypothetical protein C0J52_21823 [Blattella germanica]|nr:hypothetical protein C0J52_21823 [Blattella germanica]
MSALKPLNQGVTRITHGVPAISSPIRNPITVQITRLQSKLVPVVCAVHPMMSVLQLMLAWLVVMTTLFPTIGE